MHNSKRKEEGGALQDKAVRRDWFSETQLRDGHKKDESEKKGIKSLGESQTNNPRFQKISLRIYVSAESWSVIQKGGKARSLGALFRPKDEEKAKVSKVRPCIDTNILISCQTIPAYIMSYNVNAEVNETFLSRLRAR